MPGILDLDGKTLMRTIFFGSDDIALPLLNRLRQRSDVQLVGIVSQPDRPCGRGKKIQKAPIAAWAEEHGIEVIQPEKITSETVRWLQTKEIEWGLVMAYGHILPKTILDLPSYGLWNIHTSLLPRHRGPSPISYALLKGDQETGVTWMKMIFKLDAGPLLKSFRIPIESTDTAVTLRHKLSIKTAQTLDECFPLIAGGPPSLTEQEEGRATYTKKIKKEDGRLNFGLPAQVLERQIRAFHPWPGSYFHYNSVRIKVGGAIVKEETPPSVPAGTVVNATTDGLAVRTGEGCLILTSLQRDGGNRLPAAEFLRGFPIPPGKRIFPSPET